MKQHSKRFLSIVAESKKHIKEISPLALKTSWVDAGFKVER